MDVGSKARKNTEDPRHSSECSELRVLPLHPLPWPASAETVVSHPSVTQPKEVGGRACGMVGVRLTGRDIDGLTEEYVEEALEARDSTEP